MRSFVRVVCLAALVLALPNAVHATIRTDPVRLRAVGPAPVLRPGERASITFEIQSSRPVGVTGLSVESSSLARPFVRHAVPLQARPDAMPRVTVDVLPTDDPEPLVIRYEVDGKPYQQTVDLASRMESAIARRSALEPVPGRAPKPMPARMQARADSVRGAGGSSNAGGTIIFFSGRLEYTRPGNSKNPPREVGALGVRVKLMDEDSGPDDEVGYTYTDYEGDFHGEAYWTGQAGEGDPELYIEFETDHPWVLVQQGFWDVEYSWSTSVRPSSTADVHIGTFRPSDSSTHPALHLATTIARSHLWYDEVAGIFVPDVDVKWPSGDWPEYDPLFGEGTIHFPATDMVWSERAITHEYGHFFVDEFAQLESPDYCNGICDDPDCGHCLWCQENLSDAFQEGWVQWASKVQTRWHATRFGIPAVDQYDLEPVSSCGGTFQDGARTEGNFAATLWDLFDDGTGTDDMDPNGFGGYRDRYSIGSDEIITVLTVDEPTTTRGFLAAVRDRYPQYKTTLWEVGMNNRFDLDQVAPDPPTSLGSTSHPISTGTANLNVTLTWSQPGPDDWSGVFGYSIVFAAAPTLPDAVLESAPTSSYISPQLPPGTYYASVATVDRSGRVSTTYATYGPFTVIQPTPVDIAPYTPAGWSRPLVCRATGDMTSTFAPDPVAQLPGNTALTYMSVAGRNQGQSEQFGFLGIRNTMFVDGYLVSGTLGYVHPNLPGETYQILNRSETIRGGRHMVGVILDGFNEWWEANEVNNYWSHPYVWSPLVIPPNVAVRRMKRPPNPVGSWSGVFDGSPLHYNCDGIRYATTGWWDVVWLAADSDTSDFDLRLHTLSNSVHTGFDTPLASSMRPAGYLDLIISNTRVIGSSLWDLGVINDLSADNYGDPDAPFVVKQVSNSLHAFGDTSTALFPDSEMVVLREVFVPAAGPVSITLWPDTTAGTVYVDWLDRTYSRGTTVNPVAVLPGEKATINATAGASGHYAVVLFRDPKDGRGARQVTLGVGARPPDLQPLAVAGWYAPIVPRPTADASTTSVPEPTSLSGSPASTYLNYGVANFTPVTPTASSIVLRLAVDGESYGDLSITPPGPGSLEFGMNLGPYYMWGGRHLLGMTVDLGGAVVEADDENNAWGEQWVWSPTTLALGGGYSASPPPDPAGGFETFSGVGSLYYNSLGFRTTFDDGTGLWGGVGLVPYGATDSDLRLHDLVAGVHDGFGVSLRSSSWGPGETDFCIVRHDAPRTVDISVVRGDEGAPGSFDLGATGSADLAALPLSTNLGIPNQEALRLHPVLLPAGTTRVRVTNVFGTIDWGVSLHADSLAVQSRLDAVEQAFLAGPGLSEEFLVALSEPDTFVVAVWKHGGADHGQYGAYHLDVEQITLDRPVADVPVTTRLHGARPAPFRDRTTLAFDLATAGESRIEVFDLRGARVRTLAAGRWPAGRHSVEWRGDDDQGRRVAPGVYLARLEAGPVRAHQKLIMLE